MDERELIRRVEAADPIELAEILNRATSEEEKVLEDYLGPERYRRMRRLATGVGKGPALETRGFLGDFFGAGGGPAKILGNLVFLPGIMGSELSVSAGSDAGSTVWLSLWRIALGQIARLRLARNGVDEFDGGYRVRPTGILKKYYGEMALSLARTWNVKTFSYDWRKDLDLSADSLHAKISEWFSKDEPVHIVAHSMGGLVARTFIKRYPERWATMSDPDRMIKGGRLIMLGTPNRGSFLVPQMVTGLASTIQKLAMADMTRDLPGILEILNTFVGAWQMLPSPAALAAQEVAPLYDAKTYGVLNVNQAFLDNAKAHHEFLADVVDPARMIYVAGYNQSTHAKIVDFKRIDQNDAYEMTFQGDGSVPHSLGFLDGLTTYFVESEHSALTSNAKVLGSIDALLLGQVPAALGGGQAVKRGAARATLKEEGADEKQRAASEMLERQEREVKQFEILYARMRSRGLGARGAAGSAEPEPQVTETERRLEEELVRGFLSPSDTSESGPAQDVPENAKEVIELALILGSIDDLDGPKPAGPPVDAIAVGHYLGIRPAAAERMLDEAISAALQGVKGTQRRLVLTEFTDRNILRGLVGQPFFLDDPRPAGRRKSNGKGRVIVVAGMGRPGNFGVPELIVLARELCWSLGRTDRDHLASVLIGSGSGNIPPTEAVEAWLTGLAEAVAEAARDGGHWLKRVTIIEYHPERIREIDAAIRRAAVLDTIRRKAKINYKGLQFFNKGGDPKPFATIDEVAGKRLDNLIRKQIEDRQRKALAAVGRNSTQGGPAGHAEREEFGQRDATRLNVEYQPIVGAIVGLPPTALPVPSRARYIYSAITESASVPEREVVIDPELIKVANNELSAHSDLSKQYAIGKVLGQLLLHDDLAAHLNSRAPLVLTVDSTTARIHWEMVAQPIGGAEGSDDGPRPAEQERLFLGTYRTLTRQFRTSFAGLPNSSHAPRRELRVLVVADPAGPPDALIGARNEGMAVADLFERFNADSASRGSTRIVVESLIGPREATRFEVMSRLLNGQYDVLHFAGHCYFNQDDPSASGWIFDKREVLSAFEMRRVKQVPRFVFSNACESGITPDRSRDRSAGLAPSFAEAFFAQGVANFVCTAWPVDDATALRFATCLYSGLLGFDPENPNRNGSPLSMHRAMQEARLAVLDPSKYDTRTWGAYQHYGNPHFRFIDQTAANAPAPVATSPQPAPKLSTRAKRKSNRPKRGRAK